MKHRVFLVEDHDVVSEAMTELIHLEGDYEVVGRATSGKEAFDTLEGVEVDLVIADISLPGMNGLELTRALVARDPSVRVLVVSGHQDALYMHQAREAGAHGFVTKGQIVGHLIPAMNALLNEGKTFIHA